jgi:hypothetical protein
MPITGEASPYYLFHPLAPQRVQDMLPDAMLIVLLRNPIDRAYSHYHHVARKGPAYETLTFEQAIEAEWDRLDGEAERLTREEAYRSLHHQHHSYLSRGIYVDQLKTWYQKFPARQLLILCAEKLFEQAHPVVQDAFQFLELPQMQIGGYRPRNQGKYHQMATSTREKLSDFFRPYNQQLWELLGVDYDWD